MTGMLGELVEESLEPSTPIGCLPIGNLPIGDCGRVPAECSVDEMPEDCTPGGDSPMGESRKASAGAAAAFFSAGR